MSQPFDIDSDRVGDAGAGWGDTLDFGAPPPQVSGHPNDPTVAASQGAISDAQRRTRQLQNAVSRTATQTQKAAGDYKEQDDQSAKGLGEGTGIANNLIGSATSLIGEAPQAFGAFTQGLGALTGLAGSGAGIIGSLTGAAVSGQHLANPDQSDQHPDYSDQQQHGPHQDPWWNPNNNNPEGDYGHTSLGDAGGHW